MIPKNISKLHMHDLIDGTHIILFVNKWQIKISQVSFGNKFGNVTFF